MTFKLNSTEPTAADVTESTVTSEAVTDDDGTAVLAPGLESTLGYSSSTPTPTPTPTGGARPFQNSGLWDTSQISQMKSPFDATGVHVSSYTARRAAKNSKPAPLIFRAFRFFAIAITIPVAMAMVYAVMTGQDIRVLIEHTRRTLTKPDTQTAATSARVKDAHPLIDLLNRDTNAGRTAVHLAVAATYQTAATPETAATSTTASRAPSGLRYPIKLRLDALGRLVSPYSVVLDAEGQEVNRLERDEALSQLPLLPSGTPPAGYNANENSNQISYGDIDRRRMAALVARAPELKTALTRNDALVSKRLNLPTTAVVSLAPSNLLGSEARRLDAIRDLEWMRAAALAMVVNGDRQPVRRTEELLKQWASIYQPSGDAIAELPILDLVIAYDVVRGAMSDADRNSVEGMLAAVVDAQLVKFKNARTYDLWHAAHTRMSLAIGFTIRKAAFQFHGSTQFERHIVGSSLMRKLEFDTDDVRRMTQLLESAILLDRSNMKNVAQALQAPLDLDSGMRLLLTDRALDDRAELIDAFNAAVYFKPEYLPNLVRLAGASGTRFGTDTAVIRSAIRRPDSSVSPVPRKPAANH